jgi:hypothetical protein
MLFTTINLFELIKNMLGERLIKSDNSKQGKNNFSLFAQIGA